ncbi:MAG: SAM-dependent methyltransferase [Gammaproteobacteria bacterium]|nr:MAG: SAM-dependent methyltransferase [Gammaproteobacteria bacterium]
MAADFQDAWMRHKEDGDLLYAKERWANADHLYGLAVECGLKAVMRAMGMPVSSAGVPISRYHRVHLPDIWYVFHAFVSGTHAAGLLPFLSQSSPFDNWSVHQRYEPRSNFSQEIVDEHRMGLKEVEQLYCAGKRINADFF